MRSDHRGTARRKFLAQCAAIPFAAGISDAAGLADTHVPDGTVSASGDVAAKIASLLELVDPLVRPVHKRVAADRNAWPVWHQAHQHFVDQPVDADFEETASQLLDNDPEVEASTVEAMHKWLESNQQSSKLSDKGIERGELELPRANEGHRLTIASDEFMAIRQLSRLKAVESLTRLKSGDVAGALERASATLRIGKIYIQSECLIVDYLISQAIMNSGMRAMTCVGTAAAASPQHIKSALDRLSSLKPTIEDTRSACSVELCRRFVPYLATSPDTRDATALATNYVTQDMAEYGKPNEGTAREAARATGRLTKLLDGHPNPFDKTATVRLASSLYLRFIEGLKRPWFERDRSALDGLDKELADLPAEVEPDMWIALNLGENPDPPEKLSDAAFDDRRLRLRKVDNVLGKHVANQITATLRNPFSDRHEAGVQAARLRIALTAYERKHGQLPGALKSLLSDGLVEEVPLDPFDGKAFKYSRDRRMFCCVGVDGRSEPTPEDITIDQDFGMVWTIETPKR